VADATGAQLLGDPDPLADALERLSAAAERIPMQVNPAAEPLYIVNPLSALHGRGLTRLFSTHPPMEERVRRLRAMRGSVRAVEPGLAYS
jgi:heat shock protein HtpX